MPPSKSKSNRANGRGSKMLNELIELCSAMKQEIHLVRKQMIKQRKQMSKQRKQLKKQRQKNRHLSNLITEVHQFLVKDQGSSISLPSKESSTVQRKLELSFVCELPTRIYTASKIYAVDDSTKMNVPMRVALLDEGREVVTDGPLSSLKIEILVAYGDFKAEEPEELTGKEVETVRVRAREGKGTLLVGSCTEIMENGACSFNDLKFVDNSSWVSSGTFKLVAKVVETVQAPEMVEIRPAVSRPFQVMDQRGKQYEKQPRPLWNAEVWRLKKIKRNGPYHKKLEERNIKTVMDFRQVYAINQPLLREILGAKDGVWATIVEHANECLPNTELRIRYDSEEGVELLFDCFYNLIGVSFDHQNERILEELNEFEKNHVEQLRRRAFEDHGKMIKINSDSGWPSAKTNNLIFDAGNVPPNEPPLMKYYRYENEEDGVALLFNSFCILIGISFDRQTERSFENLSELEQNLVEGHRKLAFDNFNNLSQINPDSEWPSAKTSSWTSPDPPPHQGDTTLFQLPWSPSIEQPTDNCDYNSQWFPL